MKADLHLHSVYSDGKYTPQELAARAKAAGLDLYSVTDHDSMEGAEEKAAAAREAGLYYVQGWEVSSYEDCKVHVLGYACERGEAYFRFLEERIRGAQLRAADMIEKANRYFGFAVTMSEAEKEHFKKDAPIHTMHVVRVFARKLGMGVGEAYLAFFDKGKPAYSDLCRPTATDAVNVIHACGGIAVLAHPGRIAKPSDEREKLMERLVSEGLDGIECVYTTHTAQETEYFTRFARAHSLLVTGGSDMHVENGKRTMGKPDFYPEEKLLAALGIPSRGGVNE